MKIDVRSEKSLYIEMDGWTFYVDNSTDEQIMNKWETGTGDDDCEWLRCEYCGISSEHFSLISEADVCYSCSERRLLKEEVVK